MLILSRRRGESIVIRLPDGRTVRVKVCERKTRLASNVVQIGVEADKDIPVLRAELREVRP